MHKCKWKGTKEKGTVSVTSSFHSSSYLFSGTIQCSWSSCSCQSSPSLSLTLQLETVPSTCPSFLCGLTCTDVNKVNSVFFLFYLLDVICKQTLSLSPNHQSWGTSSWSPVFSWLLLFYSQSSGISGSMRAAPTPTSTMPLHWCLMWPR